MLFFSSKSFGVTLDVVKEFSVADSNLNVFSTPLSVTSEGIYFSYIARPIGMSNGMDLMTILEKGTQNVDGSWRWSKRIVEDRTIEDKYHTQPSVAVDRLGHIHVAYNMHNMPWQYKLSLSPYDIGDMKFKGDAVSLAEIFKVKILNKTGFIDQNNPFIAGTQVTYPAFFYDKNGVVYLTYRFANKPQKPWKLRELSGAIGRFDENAMKWNMLGGRVDNSSFKIFAKDSQYVPYVHRLYFDANNRMHISMMWRLGGPGGGTMYPSYLYSDDGGKSFFNIFGKKLVMPISVHSSGINIDTTSNKYYAITDITSDKNGKPYVLMHKYKGKYVLTSFDKIKKRWYELSGFPGGASAIRYKNDKLYAFASGPTVYEKDFLKDKWRILIKDKLYCNPKVVESPDMNDFYFFSQSCDLKTARVYVLNL